MNNKKIEKIYYFAATHWDREWYKTVDQYRYKLIPVMDKILHTLKTDPDFQLFTLDGQTSVLEDYLVVRGESPWEEALRSLIRESRLRIGPWYTMPDEFLISGESLIQNLLYGHSICKQYQAEPLRAGYVCDTFGHIANLPQLLNGFHIKNALISRGTNDHDTDCFFDWFSPDGSRLLAFKAPETCGYGSFFFEVISEFAPDYALHLDEITEKAIQYVERELTRTSLPYVILMDGMDHETIHEFMPEILRRLKDHFHCPVVQEPLDAVFSQVQEDRQRLREEAQEAGHSGACGASAGTGSDLQKSVCRFGELTDLAKAYEMHIKLIPHTLSSRYDLKSANDRCQNLLEYYAMPCLAMEEMKGLEALCSYIRYAYSLLLQNHAHDSICGCSIDEVHREMNIRFSKAFHTAEEYFLQYCAKEYFRCVDAFKNADQSESTDAKGPFCLVKVFNPLPYEYHGAIEFDIDFAPDFEVRSLPYVKFEQRNSFLITDENDNELKYNLISASRGRNVRMFGGNKRPADTHRVAVMADLKPLGFTTFIVRPFPLPYRITEGFSDSGVSCENELIRFEIASDGTISLTDKGTGRIYSGLHSFLDCGEMGDGWFHIRPINDRSISSLGCGISIEKVFDGYAECKFAVRYAFELPSENVSSFQFVNRSDSYKTCIIRSEFTIARASALVAVRTEVDNNIRDHRLLLHLPTQVASDKYCVNQCNLILNRSIGQDNSRHTWKETDITEQSFENMIYLRSRQGTPHGLMFLSKGGLHEVSCPGDRDNSINVTLLRCFSKTVNTDGEPDGQLQGKQVFEYAIMPISDQSDCELVKIKDRYVCGYKTFTIPAGTPVPEESAFTFHSDACTYLTSMPSRKTASSIIIRAANYSGEAASCKLSFSKEITKACLCNFLEEETDTMAFHGKEAEAIALPYKIINLKITF